MRQYWRNHIFLLLVALLVVLPLTLCTLLLRVSSVYAAGRMTEYGFHFASQYGNPSKKQLALLHPQWMRYGPVVPHGLPKIPSSIKTLVIFNNESVTVQAPLNSEDVTAWHNYVDTGYIPELTNFLHTYQDITALEVWNEEDLCAGSSYCPKVPAAGYAYMIKRAASTIRALNAHVGIVMGGLGTGDPNYVRSVRNADARALEQVDAIGIHPYGKSPNAWCTSGCSSSLPFGDLKMSIDAYRNAGELPVWITEIGINSTDTYWQGKYAQRLFLCAAQSDVPVVIWYGMQDGGNGYWGLLDTNGSIKPSGKVFANFSRIIFD
jgi:hypothetical protein